MFGIEIIPTAQVVYAVIFNQQEHADIMDAIITGVLELGKEALVFFQEGIWQTLQLALARC